MKNLHFIICFCCLLFDACNINAQNKKEQIEALLMNNDSIANELSLFKLKIKTDSLTLTNKLKDLDTKLHILDSIQKIINIQSSDISYLKNKENSYRKSIELIDKLEYVWVENVSNEPDIDENGNIVGKSPEEFQAYYSSTLSYLKIKSKNSIPSICSNEIRSLSRESIPKMIDWDSFNDKDKFCYCMMYPENYSQSCSFINIIPGQEKYIMANLPSYASGIQEGEGTFQWSPRQLNFLLANREKVIDWIMIDSKNENRIGQNYKSVLSFLKAIEYTNEIINIAKKDNLDNDYWSLILNLNSQNNGVNGLLLSNFISDEKLILRNTENIDRIIQISKIINEVP
jgi:hypothetical protein